MKWPTFDQFDLKNRSILVGYVGSHSHGTYIGPKEHGIDDKDIQGICVPPKDYYYGLKSFEQCDTWVEEYDIVIYEIKKFYNLLLKNNPNVMSLLWLEPNLYVIKTIYGEELIKNRDMFSSKLAYKSFCGYAKSQLSKMIKFNHQGYMGEKRKELVTKFGYDTKNASHLIRLLRMGIEFLSTSQLNVMRHDARELIDIKKGLYTLEQVKDIANKLFDKIEDALIYSKLPNFPNYEKAENLLIHTISEVNK